MQNSKNVVTMVASIMQKCKGVALLGNDTISSSGHYAFHLRKFNGSEEFQVLVNPNGVYSGNGSAVTGCYAPQVALSEVYEFTAKAATEPDGKGGEHIVHVKINF